MESAQLLDLLGNENRRKILHLLASRPYYMSEIAEKLDVGPKAVLGHLELLVRSGMIEANIDEQRRKYFHITDNLRLEVFVSPYSFEIETTTMEFIEEPGGSKPKEAINGLKNHYALIQGYLEHRKQLMEEYREVQKRITETMGQCMEAIEELAEDNKESEILYSLLKGPMTKRLLSMQLDIPEYVLEDYLLRMEKKEIIRVDNNNYRID